MRPAPKMLSTAAIGLAVAIGGCSDSQEPTSLLDAASSGASASITYASAGSSASVIVGDTVQLTTSVRTEIGRAHV